MLAPPHTSHRSQPSQQPNTIIGRLIHKDTSPGASTRPARPSQVRYHHFWHRTDRGCRATTAPAADGVSAVGAPAGGQQAAAVPLPRGQRRRRLHRHQQEAEAGRRRRSRRQPRGGRRRNRAQFRRRAASPRVATLPRHQVGADPLLQHEDAEADVEGPERRAGLPRRTGRRRRRGGVGELRASGAGPGAQPHVLAAPGARPPGEEEAQACRPAAGTSNNGSRAPSARGGHRGQLGDGGGGVRAVPHAGDDVPRQPRVPQLQVPAHAEPRRAAAARAGGAPQARPPAALLPGLAIGQPIDGSIPCAATSMPHVYM
ncbi:hypothetical protein GQ55_9G582400 [Panicum hallii var. hallii]|uniref:Uncharacterized protein n=1 Tax=Panicum hallii var. hallii TaxID=1504633 RepID=A0A2T7CGI2_9POAL|nr:hypothetical protein GQ55_9G582400 [Panicum hallii var. hallii]